MSTDTICPGQDWWEDETTMGERPEGLYSNSPFVQTLIEHVMLPLTEADLAPCRSIGHAWQTTSPGILYIPETVSPEFLDMVNSWSPHDHAEFDLD